MMLQQAVQKLTTCSLQSNVDSHSGTPTQTRPMDMYTQASPRPLPPDMSPSA